MSAVENIKNKTVNFPVIGTVSIVTAGIVIIAGFLLFTKTNLFKKAPAKKANISYEY
jgi:hypothetical protein|tara:strand:- start:368 stop:538 length:171 start_codon:yes stop_codon:yes gene_type:complete